MIVSVQLQSIVLYCFVLWSEFGLPFYWLTTIGMINSSPQRQKIYQPKTHFIITKTFLIASGTFSLKNYHNDNFLPLKI